MIVGYGSLELLERLCEETSHLSFVHDGRNMLSVAAQRNPDPRVVALFLAHGQWPDTPDYQNITPLMYAVLSERNETVRLLLSAGARVNYQGIGGLTPLHMAVGNNGGTEISRMLLEAGADAGLRATDGMTVHDAIMRNPMLKDSTLVEEIYQKSPKN